MKNSKAALLIASAVIVGTLVLRDLPAQTKPPAATEAPVSTRLAVVDVVKLFANYQRAKDLDMKMADHRRALKVEDEKRTKQIDSIDQELKELNPSSAEYEKRAGEMTRLGIERDTWMKYEESREMQERYRLTEDMYKDITKAVAEVAAKQGFHVVLNSDDTAAETKPDIFRKIERKKVVYADPSLDITDAVLSRLNEAYKAAGK